MKNIYNKIAVFLLCLGTFALYGKSQIIETNQFKCEISSEVKQDLDILLNAAITADDEVCVKQILRKGLNPNFLLRNIKGTAPIVIAVNDRKAGILDALLKSGVDVKGQDAETALVVAASKGNMDYVQILLKAGVSPNGKGISDFYPLMLSSYKGYGEVVGLLLSFGADVNVKTNSGITSLMLASDSPKIVESLLKAGAKINELDINDRNVIFYVVENQQLIKLEILLKNGANVNLKDKSGLTLLMLAEQIKDPEQKEKIIKLLKEFGAK